MLDGITVRGIRPFAKKFPVLWTTNVRAGQTPAMVANPERHLRNTTTNKPHHPSSISARSLVNPRPRNNQHNDQPQRHLYSGAATTTVVTPHITYG